MKRKTASKFLYEGFGFPVEIHNVVMVFVDGEWLPQLDLKKLSMDVLDKLITQRQRLTGNQVKFLRKCLDMSLREFAVKVVNQSHTSVANWEKFSDKPTNMDINIEKNLRLFVKATLFTKTKEQQEGFFDSYKEINQITRASKGRNDPIQCEVYL